MSLKQIYFDRKKRNLKIHNLQYKFFKNLHKINIYKVNIKYNFSDKSDN